MALKLLGALRMMGEMAPLALNNLVLIETPIASQEKTISELAHQLEFAPCKRIQNPANFAVGIRNPEDWNPESRIHNGLESGIHYGLDSGIQKAGIRDPEFIVRARACAVVTQLGLFQLVPSHFLVKLFANDKDIENNSARVR